MNIFSNFINNLDWSYFFIGLAALICISFHEVSHGFIAYKLGDPTAKNSGRLTLNPIKHIDIFGMIMLIIAGFGWAKPVPIDIRYFKNPKRGMAITALAGPVSNLLLAFAALFISAGLAFFDNIIIYYIIQFLFILASISVGLFIFNLIPVPPLDGSKLLFSFLPDKAYYYVLKYERIGMLAMFVLLGTGVLSPYLTQARSAVISLLWNIASLPFPWF